ncbi:putative Vacuolar iron transporter Ccc1 [Seiridium cardinale]|uniref:Vacuolar iron transporter Ccc1 n=1 Tax=Seiridium cardinale TaxID=138064 RepID=A0ABR2XU75_9PEZI
MALNNIVQSLAQKGPAYESIPDTPYTPATSLSHASDGEDHVLCRSAVPRRQTIQLPTLSRFLADFTLGFADGLTVPFALTAGLSSLGQTNTVILAGMAEIAAGSISMGIGGYLSARGDIAAAAASDKASQDKLDKIQHSDAEKAAEKSRTMVLEEYLGPLRLPQHLLDAVRAHADTQPTIAAAIVTHQQSFRDGDDSDSEEEPPCSPVLNGISVAMGYLLGGLLPLFPYFFVTEVCAGLKWSFGVCIVALFIFGFTKHYLLQEEVEDKHWSNAWHYHSRRWNRIKQSAWEGLQMVILGSIAAFAALACVKASEVIVS